MEANNSLKVFTGNAHAELANAICNHLQIDLGRAEVFKFKNDNTFVRILENIRQQDVFIVQPLSVPVNDHIMEFHPSGFIPVDIIERKNGGSGMNPDAGLFQYLTFSSLLQ